MEAAQLLIPSQSFKSSLQTKMFPRQLCPLSGHLSSFCVWLYVIWTFVVSSAHPQSIIISLSLQMPRAQRFPDSFHQTLQSLVLSIMPHITIRHTEIPEEARSINLSLANFIKVIKVL